MRFGPDNFFSVGVTAARGPTLHSVFASAAVELARECNADVLNDADRHVEIRVLCQPCNANAQHQRNTHPVEFGIRIVRTRKHVG